MYHIADPDLLKEILVKHFDKFINRVVRMCIHYYYTYGANTYTCYPFVCIIYIVCMHYYKHIEHVKKVCIQLFFVEMYGYESYLRVQYRLTLLHATELRVIGHVNTDTPLYPLDFKSTINPS